MFYLQRQNPKKNEQSKQARSKRRTACKGR
jgi:hypothetical protein